MDRVMHIDRAFCFQVNPTSEFAKKLKLSAQRVGSINVNGRQSNEAVWLRYIQGAAVDGHRWSTECSPLVLDQKLFNKI